MSYEDHFMEVVKQVPIAERDAKLGEIIDDFITRQGVTDLVYQLNLLWEESENYGCSPYQVIVDVIHLHLEQLWLEQQQYWWVIHNMDTSIIDVVECEEPDCPKDWILAGPFDTEQEAEQWVDANLVNEKVE